MTMSIQQPIKARVADVVELLFLSFIYKYIYFLNMTSVREYEEIKFNFKAKYINRKKINILKVYILK